jgi:hypothetical protein
MELELRLLFLWTRGPGFSCSPATLYPDLGAFKDI